MNRIIFIIFTLFLFTCDKSSSQEAEISLHTVDPIQLNNRAMERYGNYLLLDGDSKELYKILDTLDIAISLDQKNKTFYYNKSNVLIALDSLDGAINTFLNLYKADSTQINALFLAGNYSEILKDSEKADSLYNLANSEYLNFLDKGEYSASQIREWAYINTFVQGKESTIEKIKNYSAISPQSMSEIIDEIIGLNRNEYLQVLNF